MFKNTLKLTGFILKREKISSPAWVLGASGFNAVLVLLLAYAIMSTVAERAELMMVFSNPALLAMVGPLHPEYGIHNTDFGYVYTLFMMIFLAIFVAIMNIFLVVRHTRGDEELGRYEVLRSLPSGRLANINAAMVVALIINAAITILIALSMWIVMSFPESEAFDLGSALLWGANIGVVGLVFAAVAAFFSQMSSSARGALSGSFAILGLSYFTRAVADMDMEANSEIFAYISPLGLISRTWPYVDNNWWPVLAVLAMAAIFTALAYWLCGIRDIQQGMVPARKGRAKGGRLMNCAFGLNFRLLRLSIIVWVIILFAMSAAYGTILEDIEGFVAQNEVYRTLMLGPVPGLIESLEGAPPEEVAAIMNTILEYQGFNIIQMFANMTGFITAMFAAIPVLLFILRAKSEEVAMRAEAILATKTSRTKYLAGLVALAFGIALLGQLAQAFGMFSLAYSMEITEQLPLRFLLESTLVYVPALWVLGGVAVLLVGIAPRRSAWIWALYGFTFFVMMYGRMLPDLEFLIRITPMGWVPQLPVDDISWLAMGVLTLIGLALAALGIVFYNKRDINVVS